jgi:endonuclease-3
MKKQELFDFVIKTLSQKMPNPKSELNYENAFQLLCAVILSAQCTDKRVNIITPELFKRFPQASDMKNATFEQVFDLVKSCSYPNNKTKNLIAMATVLVDKFNSIVPDNIEELQELPGVGRKTANVIAAVVFNKPALAVDTHVFRVSNRIGLTDNSKNPLQTEQELIKYLPDEIIPDFHHWLILHGRYTCKAKNPLCTECELKEVCKYYKNLKIS